MSLQYPAYRQVRPVTAVASVLIGNNPGPLTLEGTNTWILRDPDSNNLMVIDPGPADDAHLNDLVSLGTITMIALTHRHRDHGGGLEELVNKTNAPVYGPPSIYPGSYPIRDNMTLTHGALSIRVISAPGHTRDSCCFLVDDSIITGDTILGRGTTILDPHDGDLGAYLQSLQRLTHYHNCMVLPGHGPEHPSVEELARRYLDHRYQRLRQIQSAREKLGDQATIHDIARYVYPQVDPSVWPALLHTVQVQLHYLNLTQ